MSLGTKEILSREGGGCEGLQTTIYKPGDLPECCTETFVSDHE